MRKINKIREAGMVRRYHTRDYVTRDQSIADHSWNVAQIVLYIDPDCSRELLIAALDHDTGEAYTGDLPAPFKWDNPGVNTDLKTIESQYMREIGIENDSLTRSEKNILHYADTMECMIFAWEELWRGNRAMRDVFENAKSYLSSKMPPSKEAKTLLDAWGAKPPVV